MINFDEYFHDLDQKGKITKNQILKKFPIGSSFVYKSEYGAFHILEVHHASDSQVFAVSSNDPEKFVGYSHREITPYYRERKLKRILKDL